MLLAGRGPNLASAVLARVLGRLCGDYLAVYGHRVLAVWRRSPIPLGTPVPAMRPANFAHVGSTLTMVAAATISGAPRSFRSVADYVADLSPDALARLGARHHPVTGHPAAPREATIRRTVKDVDANEADTLVGTWLHAKLQAGLVSPKAWRGLAVDGKTLKGAWEEVDTGAGKVGLFSALTHAQGVVVGQRRIPDNTGSKPR